MHHLRTQKAFLAAVLIRQFNPHIHRSGNVDLVSVFIRDLDIKQAHVRSAALCPAQGIFGSGNVFVIQRGIKRLFASGNGFIAFRRQYFRNLQLCVFRNSGFRAVGGRYPVIPSIAGQYILLDDSSDNPVNGKAVGFKRDLADVQSRIRRVLGIAARACLDAVRVGPVASRAGLDALSVPSPELGLDELGSVLFFLIKMNGVQPRVCRHFHRFVVFDPHIHLAGGLPPDPVAHKADVIESCERYARIFVVLVLELFLRPVPILLILLFVLLPGDLSDLQNSADRKHSIRGDRYIDIIIPASGCQFRLLRDELF